VAWGESTIAWGKSAIDRGELTAAWGKSAIDRGKLTMAWGRLSRAELGGQPATERTWVIRVLQKPRRARRRTTPSRSCHGRKGPAPASRLSPWLLCGRRWSGTLWRPWHGSH